MVTIKWNGYAGQSYTAGSQMSFTKEGVWFENALMSPGFSLMSWHSKTHYQRDRKEPSLPLLYRGLMYQILLEVDVWPAESLYVKVTFFNRLEEKIEEVILKDTQWTFTYPQEAFSYTIDLINAGCERLYFREMQLSELRTERVPSKEESLEPFAVYFPKETHRLHIVFLEPETSGVEQLPQEVLEELGNVLFVTNTQNSNGSYLLSDAIERLMAYLWFCHDQGLTEMFFIGYGPVGNLEALYYGARFSGTVYMSEQLDWSSLQKDTVDLPSLSIIETITDYLNYSSKIHRYGQLHEQHALVSSLFDGAMQLRDLPLL